MFKRLLALIMAIVVQQCFCCCAAQIGVVKSYYMLKYEYESFVKPLTEEGATESEMLDFFEDLESILQKKTGLNRENFETHLKMALMDVAAYREHRNLSNVIFKCYGDDIDEYAETDVIPERLQGVYEALLEVLFGSDRADKTELVKVYEEYKAVLDTDSGKYTSETVNALKSKLSDALAVLRNKEATTEDITSAKAELKEAYEALEIEDNSNGGVTGGGSSSGGGISAGGGSSSGSAVVIPGKTENEGGNNEEVTLKFADVPEAHWSSEAVYYLADKDVISGYGDSTFKPDKYVLREEISKMFCIAFDIKPSKEYVEYNDVARGAWYDTYIQDMTANNIMQGIGDNSFGTGMTLTRQDLAVIVYRMLENGVVTKAYTEDEGYVSFDDLSEASDYAQEAIDTMKKFNIINGVGNNRFAPLDGVTRAQAAQIIYNILK